MRRNIDQDVRLLIMARRCHDPEDQLTEKQMTWVLESEGYSKSEIENALFDYYEIHVKSQILLHHWIAPVVLVLVMTALVIYVQSLLTR